MVSLPFYCFTCLPLKLSNPFPFQASVHRCSYKTPPCPRDKLFSMLEFTIKDSNVNAWINQFISCFYISLCTLPLCLVVYFGTFIMCKQTTSDWIPWTFVRFPSSVCASVADITAIYWKVCSITIHTSLLSLCILLWDILSCFFFINVLSTLISHFASCNQDSPTIEIVTLS